MHAYMHAPTILSVLASALIEDIVDTRPDYSKFSRMINTANMNRMIKKKTEKNSPPTPCCEGIALYSLGIESFVVF